MTWFWKTTYFNTAAELSSYLNAKVSSNSQAFSQIQEQQNKNFAEGWGTTALQGHEVEL